MTLQKAIWSSLVAFRYAFSLFHQHIASIFPKQVSKQSQIITLRWVQSLRLVAFDCGFVVLRYCGYPLAFPDIKWFEIMKFQWIFIASEWWKFMWFSLGTFKWQSRGISWIFIKSLESIKVHSIYKKIFMI